MLVLHVVFSDLHGYWPVMSWRLRTRVYMTVMCPIAGWVWCFPSVSSGVFYLVMFVVLAGLQVSHLDCAGCRMCGGFGCFIGHCSNRETEVWGSNQRGSESPSHAALLQSNWPHWAQQVSRLPVFMLSLPATFTSLDLDFAEYVGVES